VLDAHGISHGVLTAPSFYGTDNSLLLDALDQAAGRLRGTVIVAPDVDRSTLEKMAQRGAVGIRLNWFRRAALPDAASADYRRLFAAVRDLGWHVEIYLEGPLLADVLPRIRASGARVVVDHFGSPDPAHGVACAGFQRVLEGVRTGDTFVKLSASYRQGGADCQRYVDALLAAGGPRQLVWASDWPFVSHEDRVSYEACVNDLRRWVPDATTRRIILAETPVALFGFDRPLTARTRRSTEDAAP
jgi:predicted TIM-barrel fold metal-dependent hydrolase